MSYHEVPEFGPNKVKGGAAYSYHELLENFKNWGRAGAARRLCKLIGIDQNMGREGVAASCRKLLENEEMEEVGGCLYPPENDINGGMVGAVASCQ